MDLFIGPCCRPIFYYAISVVIGGLHGLLTCNYFPRGVVFVYSVAEKGHMPPPIHPADRQDIVPEDEALCFRVVRPSVRACCLL